MNDDDESYDWNVDHGLITNYFTYDLDAAELATLRRRQARKRKRDLAWG